MFPRPESSVLEDLPAVLVFIPESGQSASWLRALAYGRSGEFRTSNPVRPVVLHPTGKVARTRALPDLASLSAEGNERMAAIMSTELEIADLQSCLEECVGVHYG